MAPQVRYLKLERETLSGKVADKEVTGKKVPWGRELMKLNDNESDLLNAIQDTLMITVKGALAGRPTRRQPRPGTRAVPLWGERGLPSEDSVVIRAAA